MFLGVVWASNSRGGSSFGEYFSFAINSIFLWFCKCNSLFLCFSNEDALGCASVCDKLVTESFSSFLPLDNSLFHPLTDSSAFCFHHIKRSYLQFPSKDFHLSSQVMEDAHSPPRLRVIGTLSNRFSNLFPPLVLKARVLISYITVDETWN